MMMPFRRTGHLDLLGIFSLDFEAKNVPAVQLEGLKQLTATAKARDGSDATASSGSASTPTPCACTIQGRLLLLLPRLPLPPPSSSSCCSHSFSVPSVQDQRWI